MRIWVRSPVNLRDGTPLEVPEDVILADVRNRQHHGSPWSMSKAKSMLAARGVVLGEPSMTDMFYVSPSVWASGEMRGLYDAELEVVPAKRYKGNPRIVVKVGGREIANISAQNSCYTSMAILTDCPGSTAKIWMEPTEFGKIRVIPIYHEGKEVLAETTILP